MDPRITEFQCIMPIANIPLVMRYGILSYERAASLPHRSVAMQPVQERRDHKQVPGGLRLHQYANLYFHARNPMLYKRRPESDSLCVLRVSTGVLQLPGVVITDRNAASNYARFLAPHQWSILHFDDILALDWNHPGNPPRYQQHKSRKCAEVLVPGMVDLQHINGAYVIDKKAENRLMSQNFNLPIQIAPVLFFRDTGGV